MCLGQGKCTGLVEAHEEQWRKATSHSTQDEKALNTHKLHLTYPLLLGESWNKENIGIYISGID